MQWRNLKQSAALEVHWYDTMKAMWSKVLHYWCNKCSEAKCCCSELLSVAQVRVGDMQLGGNTATNKLPIMHCCKTVDTAVLYCAYCNTADTVVAQYYCGYCGTADTVDTRQQTSFHCWNTVDTQNYTVHIVILWMLSITVDTVILWILQILWIQGNKQAGFQYSIPALSKRDPSTSTLWANDHKEPAYCQCWFVRARLP